MLKRHLFPESGPRGERGNIIVAVMIIMVLSTIATAMTFRVIADGSLVLTRQNTQAATAQADAGVSDALFRLDQGAIGTGGATTFCVSGDGHCSSTSVPGAPGASYVATQVSNPPVSGSSPNGSQVWTIDALGTVNSRTGAVQETVTRTPLYHFAVFSKTATDLHGNSSSCCDAYSAGTPASATNPNPNGTLTFGTDGTITCSGGTSGNINFEYYNTTDTSADCEGGVPPPANVSAYNFNLNLPAPVIPQQNQGCPNGGNLGTGASGFTNPLPAGVYVCSHTVTISGVMDVAGPVKLYINVGSAFTGTDLDIAAGSYVNDDFDQNCSSVPCATPLPVPANLQIFDNGSGSFGHSNGQGYYLGATVYAPGATTVGNGCKSVYYGSLVVGSMTCNGGPHFSIHYDNTLGSIYSPWAVSNYTVMNPGTVQAQIP